MIDPRFPPTGEGLQDRMPLFPMALPVCSIHTHRVPGVVCGFGDHVRRPRWITDRIL